MYELKLNDKKWRLSFRSITISRNIFHHLLYINDISPEATIKKNIGVSIDKNLSLTFVIFSLSLLKLLLFNLEKLPALDIV